MVEGDRVAFGHAVVAQAPELEWELGVHVREVERVAQLVEEGGVVVIAAERAQDELDLVRNPDRRAEGPRSLGRALREVVLDPPAGQGIQPHRLDHPADPWHHPVALEGRQVLGAVEEPRQIVAAQLRALCAGQTATGVPAQQILVDDLGLGEKPVGRLGQPVEIDARKDLAISIVGGFEQLLGDLVAALDGLAQEGGQPLRDDRQARLLEALTPAAFGLPTDLERQSAVLDLRAVDLRRGGSFQRERLVGQLSGAVPLDAFGQELAEEAVAAVRR